MRPALLLAALLQATALGPTTVPCSNKDVANGIRDGLQSALRSRKSRLAVELPPGAPLALRGGDDDAGDGADDVSSEDAGGEMNEPAPPEQLASQIACIYMR